MPLFITIGYGDEAGYQRTDPQVRAAAHRHDDELRASGVQMGIAGDPVQVRNHAASGIETRPGPFLRADLPLAGFAVIEADDLDQAVRMAAGSPCAVADGVIEVWPILSTP